MPETPPTAEGWYVGHDFRTVDWDAWREAGPDRRRAAIEAGVDHLTGLREGEGDSAVFAVLGHEADLLVVTLRPSLGELERDQRAFESTAFAAFTERTDSFTSVTEVSGYVSQDYFEDDGEVDPGLREYVESKLTPEIPEGYVSFYPMSKRRHPDENWYLLSFEDRAELMAAHGETGREHAGDIRQVITAALGFDDWEWGVTLFSDDPTALKDVVYDMRFDEVSARFAEFGPFYVGRRFPPTDLEAYLAGEAVPTGDSPSEQEASTSSDSPPAEVRNELANLEVYGGQPRGEDIHARVVYSLADLDDLDTATDELSESFDHYDTHRGTAVYENPDGGPAAVVSRWDTERAADIAAGFLADLPGVDEAPGAPDAAADGWGTMGMFYTVKPEHRSEFVDRFDDVRSLLADTDGHRGTDLLVNVENENDMFIASRWDSRDDAMGFFRSDAFSETVSWGRDVLADRPRHVFLA